MEKSRKGIVLGSGRMGAYAALTVAMVGAMERARDAVLSRKEFTFVPLSPLGSFYQPPGYAAFSHKSKRFKGNRRRERALSRRRKMKPCAR